MVFILETGIPIVVTLTYFLPILVRITADKTEYSQYWVHAFIYLPAWHITSRDDVSVTEMIELMINSLESTPMFNKQP